MSSSLNLNAQEQAAYEQLFVLADADKDGSISASEVSFLFKSGLSKEVLGQVWALCSQGKTSLSKEQFFIALRLVLAGQQVLKPVFCV
jgi:Ca2+-binding EF-hand superfamily protein